MAFDYQTLKNLRNDAIIDGAIATSDFADGSITASNIIGGNITAAKLATSAIDNTSGITTGTLPYSKGGTQLTSFAGANRAIYSDGSNLRIVNSVLSNRGVVCC